MKTEREIYLKPLTLREQVAMEQGICQASIIESPQAVSVKSMAQDFTQIDATSVSDKVTEKEWYISWE